jgi:hypothetical protein
MAKHRTHSIEFKRQVVQEFLGGESPHALAGSGDAGVRTRTGRAMAEGMTMPPPSVSPLCVEIALHYYAMCDEFPRLDAPGLSAGGR